MRAIGSDLHMDYTAVGQTTHLAARMEQLAEPGTTLLTAPTTLRAGRGLRAGDAARARAGQGPGRARGGLRARRGRRRRARGFRPRPRAGFTRSSAATPRSSSSAARSSRPAGPRPGRRRRRRARRGQVAPGLRVHPLPPRRGLAGRSKRGASSYGKATPLPARDRPAARPTSSIDERDDRRATSARRSRASCSTLDESPRSRRCRRCSRSSTCPSTTQQWQALDPPQRRQRTLDAVKRLLLRESQVQPLLAGLRGPALDRRRDAGAARQPGREPARRAAPAPRQLPARVPARLGQQDLLHAAPRSTRCRRESAEELLAGAARAATPSWRRSRRSSSSARRATPSSWRRACGRWSRPGSLVGERGAYRLAQAVARHPGAGHRAGRAGRAHRPAPARGEAPAAGRRRHRQGRALRRCSQAIADVREEDAAPPARAPPGRRVPLRDAASSPSSSTPSSTRSPTRWPTAASCRSAGARCTRASSRRSSAPRRPAGGAGRAARPPRPARRGVGQGARLLPPGGRQGHGALCAA